MKKIRNTEFETVENKLVFLKIILMILKINHGNNNPPAKNNE